MFMLKATHRQIIKTTDEALAAMNEKSTLAWSKLVACLRLEIDDLEDQNARLTLSRNALMKNAENQRKIIAELKPHAAKVQAKMHRDVLRMRAKRAAK